MADPLKEINNSNIQIVYETNDEDIEIGIPAGEDLNMEVIEEKDELILGKVILKILRLFLVHHLLLPASYAGGLVIHWTGLNWLDST